MLQSVDVGERSLASYDGLISAETFEQLRAVGARLRGLRLLHLNATPNGRRRGRAAALDGPSAERPRADRRRKTISGDRSFFEVTKAMHNALQGSDRSLGDQEKAAYRAVSEANAALLDEQYDFVFAHDPQPAAIPSLGGKGAARWDWRRHIDTSGPNQEAWAFICPYLAASRNQVFQPARSTTAAASSSRFLAA